jgi:hypothetical protein
MRIRHQIMLSGLAISFAIVVQAQVTHTNAKANLRDEPGGTSNIVVVLKDGARVTIVPDSTAPRYLYVRAAGHREGWVLKRYVDDPVQPEPPNAPSATGSTTVHGGGGGTGTTSGSSRTCDNGTPQPFYRWNVKVGTAEHATQKPTTVAQMHTQWAIPDGIDHSTASFCAPPAPDEGGTFVLIGYVSRIMKKENDLDWHVEVVAQSGNAKETCVVVEIPDPQYGARFQAARDKLDQLVGARFNATTGYVTPNVKVRVVGAAFFDGTHMGSGNVMNKHGNCNAGRGALWELHPVFEIGSAP